MKIVRHIARDMRQAMRAIRERLGDDAVILSSRRVGDGVEVTAAIDFDAASLEAENIKAAAAIAEVPPSRSEVPTYRAEQQPMYDQSLLIRRELQAALLPQVAETHQIVASVPVAAPTPVLVAPTPIPAPAPVSAPALVSTPALVSATALVSPPAPVSISAPQIDIDLDSLEGAFTSTAEVSQPSAPIPDAVGAELKTLRRMLETQLAQLAWNDMTRRAPIHTETLRELTEIGIAQDLASHITEQLPEDTDLTYARRFAIAALSQYLLVTGDRWLENGGRIAFIGATGVGKTTTLAKLAVRWVLRHGPRDLALVAADGVRLGAQDQMQSLGQLLGAPVYVPENFETLPTLLSHLQQRFILIDTPGSSLRDTQLPSRLSVLASSASQLQTALVLAASTQAGALEEVVRRFAPANPCCCVLTKVDEAASLGGALSVLIRARIPVSYVSEGQRVPEDLRPARALELVSNAVRLAKASGAAADEDLLRRRFGKIAHAIT